LQGNNDSSKTLKQVHTDLIKENTVGVLAMWCAGTSTSTQLPIIVDMMGFYAEMWGVYAQAVMA